jgi:hypothetical protein
MARINTYANDENISGNDKVLGTDTTSVTRNYTFTNIGNYLNKANVVSILGQNNFVFQKELINGVRQEGSVSFLGYSGAGTQLSAITSLVFSAKNSAGINVNEFITSLVGKNMMFSQLDDPNNYAQYKLNGFTEISNEPGFYTASLQYISGSGAISENAYYGLALYSLGGGANWGEIEGTVTDQTDLVNYITSRLSSDTINDAADVLQVLENGGLTLGEDVINAKVPFTIFGKDENGDIIVIPNTTTPLGYTLPKPSSELLTQGVPHIMVTKSDGTNINLSWLNLGFALEADDTVSLDGGTFT